MMPADVSDPSLEEEGSNQNGFINDLSLPNHRLQYAKCSKLEPLKSFNRVDYEYFGTHDIANL